MTNHKQLLQSTILGVLTAGIAAMALTGCGGKETPPPVVQSTDPEPPPPPPPPKVATIADLMSQLGIDERVMLAETDAPASEADRIALLNFFDAMVRGDSKTVSEMIPLTDREQLEAIVSSGQWANTTGDAIDMVELKTGVDPTGTPVVLALYTTGLELQPQMWTFGSDEKGHVFEAVPGPPDILDRISGTDVISEWFKYLDEELAMADEADIKLVVSQRNLSSDSGSSAGSGGGGSPNSPVQPPPAGKQRRPIPKAPIRPPGP